MAAMTDDSTDARPRATPEALLDRLEALGIETETHRHDAVFTVAEAQDLRGALPGAHCKSLFLRDKKGAQFLVVCLEDRRLDMKALSGVLGSARLSFGSPERLMALLGVTPGSVTPFAAINLDEAGRGAIRIVLDAEMMAADIANYHPLVNTATTAIRPPDLLRFLADCGASADVVALGPATQLPG
jgi:Ala-tRNA(Pro) deacylase